MERIRSGIDGLDELIGGGFPKGSFVVVTGGPGTGKTIMGLQFLANGIKHGEKGIFITVEEAPEEIINQASLFGWNFKKLMREGKLELVRLTSEQIFDEKSAIIKKLIEENHYSRIVIDSITSLIFLPSSPTQIATSATKGMDGAALTEIRRANASMLIEAVKASGATAMGLAQKIEGMPGETADTISEFKGDGLIILGLATVGEEENRTLQVKKLRKTKITTVPYGFKFSVGKGICLQK